MGQRAQQDARALALALVAGLLLWSVAYQMPIALHLAIGGDVETHRRRDDAPFLHGFNYSEPAHPDVPEWWRLAETEGGSSYRWAESDARIVLPGAGGGRWVVTLLASSGRPDGTAAPTTWHIGSSAPLSFTIDALPRAYHILTAADAAGTLTLQMETPAYASPDDPRSLGFVVSDLHLAPTSTVPRMPALAPLGWLAMALALTYGLARWLVLPTRPALLLALALAGVAALLLATRRFALTLFTPTLAGLLLVCWGVALLLVGVARLHPTTRSAPHGAAIALVILAFALRMGGMLHPHAEFSDHRLNANNVLELVLGNIYFTEGLPAEAGGGHAPYPPAFYLVVAPLQLLLPVDMDGRVLLVQFGAALLDSLVVGLMWLLLWWANAGQRAALLGAALYLLPGGVLPLFIIGNYANIGGQALALPAIAGLVWLLARRRGVARWVGLLCVGLLAHMGVTISLGLLLAAAWLLLAGAAVQRGGAAGPALRLVTLGGVLAVLLVLVCYYSAPLFTEIYTQRFAGEQQSISTTIPMPVVLRETARALLAPTSRLGMLLVSSGLVGAVLLWYRCQRTSPVALACHLAAVLGAWWLGTICSLGLYLVARQVVRWQQFLYPALCIGAGVAFAAFWRRGRAGHLVAAAGMAVLVVQGLTLWITQIYEYLH